MYEICKLGKFCKFNLWKYNRIILINALVSAACVVEFYENGGYRGEKETYIESGNLKNEKWASSLKVLEGCCVTVYKEKNFQIELGKLCHDVRILQWNDQISSFKLQAGIY